MEHLKGLGTSLVEYGRKVGHAATSLLDALISYTALEKVEFLVVFFLTHTQARHGCFDVESDRSFRPQIDDPAYERGKPLPRFWYLIGGINLVFSLTDSIKTRSYSVT